MTLSLAASPSNKYGHYINECAMNLRPIESCYKRNAIYNMLSTSKLTVTIIIPQP